VLVCEMAFLRSRSIFKKVGMFRKHGADHHELCTIYFSVLWSIHYVLCAPCSEKRRSSSDQNQRSFQKAISFKCFPGGFLKGPVVSEIAASNHAKDPLG
jgi:hypothetical protein